MCASRWQAPPVVICIAGTPRARMRLASFSVSRSPTSAAMRSSPRKASAVASSSAVLPDPGADIRLIARTPCPSKCARLWRAVRSLAASRWSSTSTAVVPCAMGARASFALPGVTLQPQVSHIAAQLHADEQQLVAARELGAPVAALAAQQAVGARSRFRAAGPAAHAHRRFIDIQLRAFGEGAGTGERVGAGQQARLDAGQRSDGEAYAAYTGRALAREALDALEQRLADRQLMHGLRPPRRRASGRRLPTPSAPPAGSSSGWRSRRGPSRTRRPPGARPG